MDESKNINRRQTLKKMGAVAISAGVGVMGAEAANLFSDDDTEMKKMKVLLVNGCNRRNKITIN